MSIQPSGRELLDDTGDRSLDLSFDLFVPLLSLRQENFPYAVAPLLLQLEGLALEINAEAVLYRLTIRCQVQPILNLCLS